MPPRKRVSAADLRKAVTTAKKLPVNQKGRTIGQNLKQTLDRVKNVPKTVGTGTINAN